MKQGTAKARALELAAAVLLDTEPVFPPFLQRHVSAAVVELGDDRRRLALAAVGTLQALIGKKRNVAP